MHRVVALDAHRGAAAAHRGQVGDAVPDDRGDRSRPVAERQPQVLAAVALRPQLALAHEQDAVELLSVGELAHDHGSKRRSGIGQDGSQRDSVRPVDRTALITGGTGGLGRAVVAAFASNGWRVVVLDMRDADMRGRRGRPGRPDRRRRRRARRRRRDRRRGRAAARGRQPRRRLRRRPAGGRHAGGRVRGPVRAQPAPDLPRHAGRAAGARRRGRRRRSSASRRARRCTRSRGPPATAPPRPP